MKMFILGLTFFLVSTTVANPVFDIRVDDGTTDDYGGFRLPTYQIPSHYVLDISLSKDIFDGKSSKFDGTVKITFQVTEAVSSLQLHAPMTINNIELEPSDVIVKSKSLNTTSSILTLSLNAPLKANTDYTLKITYTGEVDLKTMKGLYRSSYADDKNAIQNLLATQFEPTYARQAFPCFDEPKYKATFTISITYPQGLNAVSNVPLDGEPVVVGTDFEKSTFKQTPKMSTYLVAFVISKFDCSSSEDVESGIKHTVCSRPEAASSRALATKYGVKILKAFEDFTNIKYSTQSVGKMTQVALPDFDAGAMENWGLVTYRERLLLFDEDESANSFKQDVLTVIAHEFTHQWFGDYVTCDWWDNIFLNEGFAAYFQFFIFSEIPEFSNYELDKQFIASQQSVFVDDASRNSKAITAKVASPADIEAKFNHIVYNKAASILRMIEQNTMAPTDFELALRYYLKSKSFSNGDITDLLTALEIFVKTNYLPSGTTLSKVMDNWLNKPGYPVVTVSNDKKNLILEQTRFLYSGTGTDATSKWYIPISYTLGYEENKFTMLAPKAWMTDNKLTIENVLIDESSWVILNNQQSAFYRVNYNEELWGRIATALQENHTLIHVLNRAQIVDDSLNLARAGLLKYSQAMTTLEYLDKETDFYPWTPALTSFNYLLTRVGENTTLGDSLKNEFLKLLDGVYGSVDFVTQGESEEHIYSLKRDLILQNACRFGHKDCIMKAVSQFEKLKNDKVKVYKNLKNVVYCNGLRYSNNAEADWNFLWEKYQSTQLSTEQVTILKALGCTRDVALLKQYLDYSVNDTSGIRYQDLIVVWTSVFTSNPEGIEAALDYLAEEHEKIRTYYSDASGLVASLAEVLSSSEQLDKLKTFINADDVHESYKVAGSNAIESIITNLGWREYNREDLEGFLPAPVTEAPHTGGASATLSSMILVCFTVVRFLLL